MFPPDKKGAKPADDKKPAGPGLHESLMRPQTPQGPRPGQGMDPMQAMMMGMGDISQFGPPPPQAPGAPMGPEGMPIGGGLPSADPGMDPSMDGSSLFQALTQQLDQYAAPPEGHGELDGIGPGDPSMGLEQLLAMLALSRSGVGPGINPSGQANEPTNPGSMIGVSNPNLPY